MIATELDLVRRIVIHRGSEAVGMIDVLQAMAKLFDRSDFAPDFSIVWDLSQAELAITLDDIIHLNEEIVRAANAARPTGKTAWVTATSVGEAIIEVLYSSHDWSAEWKTFPTVESAVAWCGVHTSS